MGGGGFLQGLISGFGTTLAQQRAQQAEDERAQYQSEISNLYSIVQARDINPDVRAAALTGLMDMQGAGGKAGRKRKGIFGLGGMEENPAFGVIKQLIQHSQGQAAEAAGAMGPPSALAGGPPGMGEAPGAALTQAVAPGGGAPGGAPGGGVGGGGGQDPLAFLNMLLGSGGPQGGALGGGAPGGLPPPMLAAPPSGPPSGPPSSPPALGAAALPASSPVAGGPPLNLQPGGPPGMPPAGGAPPIRPPIHARPGGAAGLAAQFQTLTGGGGSSAGGNAIFQDPDVDKLVSQALLQEERARAADARAAAAEEGRNTRQDKSFEQQNQLLQTRLEAMQGMLDQRIGAADARTAATISAAFSRQEKGEKGRELAAAKTALTEHLFDIERRLSSPDPSSRIDESTAATLRDMAYQGFITRTGEKAPVAPPPPKKAPELPAGASAPGLPGGAAAGGAAGLLPPTAPGAPPAPGKPKKASTGGAAAAPPPTSAPPSLAPPPSAPPSFSDIPEWPKVQATIDQQRRVGASPQTIIQQLQTAGAPFSVVQAAQRYLGLAR